MVAADRSAADGSWQRLHALRKNYRNTLVSLVDQTCERWGRLLDLPAVGFAFVPALGTHIAEAEFAHERVIAHHVFANLVGVRARPEPVGVAFFELHEAFFVLAHFFHDAVAVFRRLRARDRILLPEDEERHAIDAEPLGAGDFLAHGVLVGLGVEPGAHLRAIEAVRRGDIGEEIAIESILGRASVFRGRVARAEAWAGRDVVIPEVRGSAHMTGSARFVLDEQREQCLLVAHVVVQGGAGDAAGRPEIPIVSYAVKYASAFYGPFRDAVGSKGSLGKAALMGALVGLMAYGTYDLTNHATLRNWSAALTLVDTAWGTLLASCAALAAYWITSKFA